MHFSEAWLREWVNPNIDNDTLTAQLTMAGLEVDAVMPVAGDFTGVVVAEVLSAEQHPDADKLKVCELNAGTGEHLTIVCGGKNVRAQQKVPLATIGAVLPGNFKIKKSKLRGVASHGMICSEVELGLAEQSDGIMELPEDAPVGEDIRSYLKLDDVSIAVDLTPNRADCLSIAGVAREVAVMNQCDYQAIDVRPIPPSNDETLLIDIQSQTQCPRYVGRVIKGIDPNATSPIWLLERLRRGGLRAIHPIVDITNYVMLELGQPMHAFDLAKLSGEIHVRPAKGSESLTLLDGQTINLREEDLVIADNAHVLALAGVMGGEGSAVTEETTDLFLESAYFDPIAVTQSARAHKLHTDSSHRFERGVDPALQKKAIERATQLILEITGGEAGPIIEELSDTDLPASATITLRKQRIMRVLGITLDDLKITDILTRLGMNIHDEGDHFKVEVPSYRFDIKQEIDLIEELARIYGYDQIPTRTLTTTMAMKSHSETILTPKRLRSFWVDRGYHEAVTYSFVNPKLQTLLQPEVVPYALSNPISSELSVMRTTLFASLLPAVMHNLNRQHQRIRLFEQGLCFIPKEDGIEQVRRIAGIALGEANEGQWGIKSRAMDFYDQKGEIEDFLSLLNNPQLHLKKGEVPAFLHPGLSINICEGERNIGYCGALHPKISQNLKLPKNLYGFEINFDIINKALVPEFKMFSKFPSVRRDIAILIDEKVTAEQVMNQISESASDLLQDLKLFDIYQGEGVPEGKKSLALALTLQHPLRTLVESEVNEVMEQVINALQDSLHAQLRQ